jgi:hypothetical protein
MPDEKKHEIATRQRTEIAQDAARDASAAAIGALVGVALGGVPGAIAGAAVSPVLTGAVKLAADVLSRRRQRAEAIVEEAMRRHSLTEAETLQQLTNHPQKADDFVSLLSQAIASDPSTDAVLSAAVGEMLVSRDETQRERILIVTDSLRGLRPTHMRVLRAIHLAGGTMSATGIAEEVRIPEVELRGVVRGLELRGMIKDSGKHPVEWKIRELGRAIMALDRNKPVEQLS